MASENPYALSRNARRFEGHGLVRHRAAHRDPSHHIGPCGPACRAGRVAHYHRDGRHLYAGRGASAAKRDFERRYGKRRGAYIYGATVGKVKREQLAARTRFNRRAHGTFAPSRRPTHRRRR